MQIRTRVISAIAAAAASAFILSGCGDDGENAVEKQTVRISHTQIEEHPQHQAFLALKKYIEEHAGDRFEIQIFPNATLGANEKVVELLKDGNSVQILDVATANLEAFDNYYSLFSLPYLFNSVGVYEQWIADQNNIKKLGKNSEKNGFTPIAAFTAGARNFYARTPILSVDDLAGKKFRIPVSPTNVAMMNMFGAAATPMAFGEVYSALQQGVIDGAENNELAMTEQKHGEIIKDFSYTMHQMCPDLIVVSNAWFSKLTPEDQKLFFDAAKQAQIVEFDLWHQKIGAAKQKAIAMGVNFHDVDVDAFRQKVLPLHQQLLQTQPELQGLYDEITAFQQGK